MLFNSQPRPWQLVQLGPVSVELGIRQRKCRCCKRPIPKGTYHLAMDADSGSSYKFCEECIDNLVQWAKTGNRRNL